MALPDAAVAALAARTEGWAAGLQLAALSLRGQPDVAGFVAAFTGSHRYVLDYLAEEVLERQSEQVRAFLLETSVLERLSAARCATRSPAAPAARRCWSRWSGPACSWCRWMRCAAGGATTTCSPTCSAPACSSNSPAGRRELHRNAAAWYEEHGLADDAIRHAVAAGEMTWAARLIEQHFDAVYSLRGEAATIQRWLSALPADLVRSRPRLLLAQAQLAATSGRVEAVEPLLDAAERASADAAEEPFEPTVGRAAQPAGERPRADRARSQLSRPAPRRRRGHGRVRFAGPGRARRGRVDAEVHRPGIPGRG